MKITIRVSNCTTYLKYGIVFKFNSHFGIYRFFLALDKNFALETYGENSRCFDHSNEAWEERSCNQVRQWQHWGSGCYRYQCEFGRLHILVNKIEYHFSEIIYTLYEMYNIFNVITYTINAYIFNCITSVIVKLAGKQLHIHLPF